MRRVRLAVAIIAVGAAMAGLAVAVDPEPRRFVAFGDSFTAVATLRGNDPTISWATGEAVSGGSLGARFEDEGWITESHNAAHTGWRIRQLVDEIQDAPKDADVVIVFLGINDVCAIPLQGPEEFAADTSFAFDALSQAHPRARVTVFEITDLVRLHRLHQTVPQAASLWSQFGYCHHIFAASDEASAQAQAQRIDAFNRVLVQQATTRGFGFSNATYWPDLTLADFDGDYFHPGPSGQAKMAAAAWPDVQPRRPSTLTLPAAFIA